MYSIVNGMGQCIRPPQRSGIYNGAEIEVLNSTTIPTSILSLFEACRAGANTDIGLIQPYSISVSAFLDHGEYRLIVTCYFKMVPKQVSISFILATYCLDIG